MVDEVVTASTSRLIDLGLFSFAEPQDLQTVFIASLTSSLKNVVWGESIELPACCAYE